MNNRFPKTAVKTMLFILVIAAAVAIPFALRKDAAARAAQEEEPWDVVITINANLAGNVGFVFQDYKIFYKHDGRFDYPSGATVNGIPWSDLEQPFEMGFTPDFTFAKIYEKQGGGDVELSLEEGQFNVSIRDAGSSASPYQVSIAMRRAPEVPEAAEAKDDGGTDAAPGTSDGKQNAVSAGRE